MNHDHLALGAAAARLADRLPNSLIVSVAEAIVRYGALDGTAARQAILHCVPTPDFRDATADFLDFWLSRASSVGAEATAVALVTAGTCELTHRNEEAVEIVWTGPETADSRFRQTEQAILEVVNAAKKRLTVVSYAVYKIPRIQEALIAAARRGVSIQVVLETPNRIEGQGEYDCILALGSMVASGCAMYYWPQENRRRDVNGKLGILHVKCAVADRHSMFLSSANFTEYAFTINMELGLLVTGGKLPSQVQQHFDRLINSGELHRI
jgi:phosphatidylserine/phosphatidylglycerophosphate/cardiolipin synthase-like enzyme